MPGVASCPERYTPRSLGHTACIFNFEQTKTYRLPGEKRMTRLAVCLSHLSPLWVALQDRFETAIAIFGKASVLQV